MRERLRCALALMCALFVSAHTVHAQGSPITYVYDEIGRLVGVVDSSGESAVYVYDAVGNLLSIERHSAGTVSIIQFTPDSGPTGTSVTIYGTGFSATPSANSVTFNGVSATVTSSTPTQIVTTVPSSATSGTIAVTTPSGSATSSTPFTVGPSNAATITGFTPGIGVPGTSVTVSGTNFEAAAANNRVKFNATHAAVSSSSSTSISTTVPAQTSSGRLTVATTSGTAIGDDFFIPPSPYAASDVGFTGRATPGQGITASLTANKIGLIVFHGVKGQRISLLGWNGTITGYILGCDALVSILKPDASVLVSSICMEVDGYLDVTTLPDSGTYTILLDPVGAAAGNLTLTVYNVPADLTGTITPGGSSVSVTTTVPGQNAILSFSAAPTDRLSLLGTNAISGQAWLSCDVGVTIRKPDGSSVASSCMEGSGYIDVQTLTSSGTYTILIDPGLYAVGSITLTLYSVPADVSGSITPGGSSVTVTTTTPGQNATLTFSATANQRVSLQGTNGMSAQVAFTCDVTVTVKRPNGTTQASTCMEDGGLIDTQTLPDAGTYSIFIDPHSWAVGSLTLTLYDVLADITGSITPGGSPVTVTITTPGQNATLTFSATANQRVALQGTNGMSAQVAFTCDVTVTLKRPNGSTQASTCMEGGGLIDTQTLADAGTYTIFIDPHRT